MVAQNKLLDSILKNEIQKKGLISKIYKEFYLVETVNFDTESWFKAWNDLEDSMAKEEWRQGMNNSNKMSLSESQKITQLFFIQSLLYS